MLRKKNIIFIVQRPFNAVDPTILIKIIVQIQSDEQQRNGEDTFSAKENRRTSSHRHQFFVVFFFSMLFELHNYCMHNADWKEPVFIVAVIYVAQYLPIITICAALFFSGAPIDVQFSIIDWICAKGFRFGALYIKANLHGIRIISLWFPFVLSASRSK